MAAPLVEAGRALSGYAALRPPCLPRKTRAGGFPFQSLLRVWDKAKYTFFNYTALCIFKHEVPQRATVHCIPGSAAEDTCLGG
ncbi:hypothetical protein [Mucilaginibacter psychrotolerans]|uniref:Uncharacterized protein n=1 Tax=Mucilaginibacter psychrotolerans TaxID=1524096 RepID=A0A4Y8S3X0_9SPHI|nr:hypothetical protein [Mucilaginibacter psychrotolerans]TFF33649.1 hypothetical protein E2R66_25105 [Mucilaginibacter psychrotolerans]